MNLAVEAHAEPVVQRVGALPQILDESVQLEPLAFPTPRDPA
jgi:hypothetical protein